MQKFLVASKYIDSDHPQIINLANALALNNSDEIEIAKACFEWVRDYIKHSADYQLNPVTSIASEVLKHGTGYCYAKSHLLAALLRANQIPAGLCYQRLSVNDNGAPYCLHGLNAVYLKQYGWYRIDARGNKEKVNAQFAPPKEQLAFPIRESSEANLPEIWPEPLPNVIHVLEKSHSYLEVLNNLPDIELL